MARPKIKTALVISLMTIGLIFIGFSAFAISRMSIIHRSTVDIVTNWMPSLGFAKDADNAFTDLRVAWRNHVIASSQDRMNRAETEAADAKERLTKALSSYDSLSPTSDELATVKSIRDDLSKFDALTIPLKKASAAHDDASAERIILGDMEPIRARIDDTLSKLIDFNTAGAEGSYQASEGSYQESLEVTAVLLVIAALVMGSSIWFAVFGIARPIQNITSSMNRLARGDVVLKAIGQTGRRLGHYLGTNAFLLRSCPTLALRLAALIGGLALELCIVLGVVAEDFHGRCHLADFVRPSGVGDGRAHLASGDLTFELQQPFGGLLHKSSTLRPQVKPVTIRGIRLSS